LFYLIALPDKFQFQRPHCHAVFLLEQEAGFMMLRVSPFMQYLPFGSKLILGP
jgi:hypothetical protein